LSLAPQGYNLDINMKHKKQKGMDKPFPSNEGCSAKIEDACKLDAKNKRERTNRSFAIRGATCLEIGYAGYVGKSIQQEINTSKSGAKNERGAR